MININVGKKLKSLISLSLAMVMTISMGWPGISKAVVGDTGESMVSCIYNSFSIPELGIYGPMWDLRIDGTEAFCIEQGKRADSYVDYYATEYCGNEDINKACEFYYYYTDRSEDSYLLVQGYIWAVLSGANVYNTLAQIQDGIYGFHDDAFLSYFINGINNTLPMRYFSVYVSDREGDQPLITSKSDDPPVIRPEYGRVSAPDSVEAVEEMVFKIYKTDSVTKNPLEGTNFKLYVDDSYYGTFSSDKNGNAAIKYSKRYSARAVGSEKIYCSNFSSLNDNYKKEAQYVTEFTSYNEAYAASKAAAKASAKLQAERLASTAKHSYRIEEDKPRENYVIGENGTLTGTFSGNGQIVLKLENDMVLGEISLNKVDAETESPQGDASLEGAVYGLFAAEDIYHPDGVTGLLYEKYSLVREFPETDSEGLSSLSDIIPGNYFVKEIIPSKGYLIDERIYEAVIKKVEETPITKLNLTVKEQVKKGSIYIVKHLQFGDRESTLIPQTPEENAEFSLVLNRTGEEVAVMSTDENGVIRFENIPFGEYTVHQKSGKEGFEFVNDFQVTVDTNEEIKRFILEDLQIVKEEPPKTAEPEVLGETFVPEPVLSPKTGDLEAANVIRLITVLMITFLAGFICLKKGAEE